jgi:type IV fimbrial biogenesis protein FimT
MLNRKRQQRGVTLIEVAVVFVLIGILLAFAAPSITQWMRNTQVRNVTSSLQAGLQRARSEAIRRNEAVQFSLLTTAANLDDGCALSATGASWSVSRQDPDCQCAADVSETAAPQFIEKHAGGVQTGAVTVTATAADGSAATTVVFNGFGRVSNASPISRIQVGNGAGADNDMRLLIGVGGTLRMCIVSATLTAAADPRACP